MFVGKKAIIFDMDGTLIDSVGVWNTVDVQIINQFGSKKAPSEKKMGHERDQVTAANRSDPNPYMTYCEHLRVKYGCHIDAASIHSIRYEWAKNYLIHSIDYKPGAEQFIKALKQRGLILAIASATKKANLEIYRDLNENLKLKAPLEVYFSLIYGREDALRMKPDPYIYQRVIKELKVKPEETLVFEDSLIGIQAARAAGIETVAIYDQYADHEHEAIKALADHYIENYGQALKTLQEDWP